MQQSKSYKTLDYSSRDKHNFNFFCLQASEWRHKNIEEFCKNLFSKRLFIKRQTIDISRDNEWKRVVQRVTTGDNEWYKEWERVVQQETTSDNKWQQMTTIDNEWQDKDKTGTFHYAP